MATHSKVLLILGAGSNIGQALATKFRQGGYKVALAARSLTSGTTKDDTLNIQADLSEPEAVMKAFNITKQTFGVPNVVVYNVAARLLTPPDDPLSVPLQTLETSRKAGLDGAYIAAQEALKGFRTLPSGTPTAFIYTGNALNQIAIPGVLPFALGKVAAAMLIEYAANAYGSQGHRFYYADERRSDGRPMAEDRSGSSHAEMYWQLAHEPKQSKWLVTFVHNQGRKDLPGVTFDGETRETIDRKLGRS